MHVHVHICHVRVNDSSPLWLRACRVCSFVPSHGYGHYNRASCSLHVAVSTCFHLGACMSELACVRLIPNIPVFCRLYTIMKMKYCCVQHERIFAKLLVTSCLFFLYIFISLRGSQPVILLPKPVWHICSRLWV